MISSSRDEITQCARSRFRVQIFRAVDLEMIETHNKKKMHETRMNTFEQWKRCDRSFVRPMDQLFGYIMYVKWCWTLRMIIIRYRIDDDRIRTKQRINSANKHRSIAFHAKNETTLDDCKWIESIAIRCTRWLYIQYFWNGLFSVQCIPWL